MAKLCVRMSDLIEVVQLGANTGTHSDVIIGPELAQELVDRERVIRFVNSELGKLSPIHGYSKSTDKALDRIILALREGKPPAS